MIPVGGAGLRRFPGISVHIPAGNAGQPAQEHHRVRVSVAVRQSVQQRADGAVLFDRVSLSPFRIIEDAVAQRVIQKALLFQIGAFGAGYQFQSCLQRSPFLFGQAAFLPALPQVQNAPPGIIGYF